MKLAQMKSKSPIEGGDSFKFMSDGDWYGGQRRFRSAFDAEDLLREGQALADSRGIKSFDSSKQGE